MSAVMCSADIERSQGLLRAQGRAQALERDDQEPSRVRVRGRHDLAPVRPAVAADVRELAGRGIVFDVVESGDLKLVDHVLTSPGIGKSAWFKDPNGSTLALFQPE
jgi:hypothetical protein